MLITLGFHHFVTISSYRETAGFFNHYAAALLLAKKCINRMMPELFKVVVPGNQKSTSSVVELSCAQTSIGQHDGFRLSAALRPE